MGATTTPYRHPLDGDVFGPDDDGMLHCPLIQASGHCQATQLNERWAWYLIPDATIVFLEHVRMGRSVVVDIPSKTTLLQGETMVSRRSHP